MVVRRRSGFVPDGGPAAAWGRSREWILKNVILPLGDLGVGQHLVGRLKFLERAQWWAPERVALERDKGLQTLVRIAFTEVPLYRELMAVAGVTPDGFRGIRDLGRLPVVSKALLRANYPMRVSRATGQRTFEGHTSGSSGENFRTLYDAMTAGRVRANFLLALSWAGWGFGESHLQMGMTLSRGSMKWLKDILFRCHYVAASELSDSHLDANLNLMEEKGIRHLWGYPGSIYCMARRALDLGWNRKLQSVVTWGDTLYPHYRKLIEAVFGRQVHDTYGCAEGIQVAAQCGCGGDYHVHGLDTVVEVLNDDGVPAGVGEVGSIVLTRLHPGPMPFLRYRVGDLGVSCGEAECQCGRGFPLIRSVRGRETDLVVTPSGKRFIVHFFTGILEHFSEIESFQVVQERINGIKLKVVPAEDFTGETAGRIVGALRAGGATDLEIELEVVESIPLTAGGKRRFVISTVSGMGVAETAVLEETGAGLAGARR